MDVRAILFDVNSTLVDIHTEDDNPAVFRAAGHFLTYQGITLRRHKLRDLYFGYLKEQQKGSTQEFPEFDAVAIWRRIIDEHATDYTHSLGWEKRAQLPLALTELTRGIARRKLHAYKHVVEVLEVLRTRFPLAIVTDGQSAWARAELHKAGLLHYFNPVIVSGDHGFRKPDRRLFQFALDGLGLDGPSALYVGNDMYRDVFGAREVGMATVLFNSPQGAKQHPDCTPDHTINDHRELLGLVGL